MHGPHCGARTFPVGCKYCGQSIFLFLCNCGSVATFESLGIPWPIHDCRHVDGSGEGEGPTFGIDAERASRIVRAFAEEQGLPVPELVWERRPQVTLESGKPGRPSKDLVRVQPGKSRVSVLGTVRELLTSVNPLKKLGIRGPIFERQVMRFLTPSVTQLTVESEKEGTFFSYTAMLPEGQVDECGLRRGALVTLDLAPKSVTGLEPIWVVKALEVLA